MKKNVLNTLGAIGIMALIALNVYVVTSKETPAFLKWDAMSYIFANGNSGSGSGSGEDIGDGSNSCSKIKETKNCYNNGVFVSVAILECEDYTAYPPQKCSSCQETSC